MDTVAKDLAGKFLGIQALRFVAALLVVIGHSVQSIERWNAVSPLSQDVGHFGSIGVDIFFVISGFVITLGLIQRPDATAGDFLIRRWIRVAPIYFVLTIPLMVPRLAAEGLVPSRFITSFLFLPVAGHAFMPPYLPPGWTLCFEMLFYAAAAATLLFSDRRTGTITMIGCYAALAVAALVHGGGRLGFFGNGLILEFLGGVGIALIWHRGINRFAGGALALSLLGFAALLVFGFGQAYDARSSFTNAFAWQRVALFGTPSLLLVYAAVQFERRLPRSRTLLDLAALGEASYMLYLFHPTVLLAADFAFAKLPLSRSMTSVTLWLVGLTLVNVVGSVLVHTYVEKPLLELLNGWRRTFEARRRTGREIGAT